MLTGAQLATLKADIDANSGLGGEFENVPKNSDGALVVAAAYNTVASPDFFAWKSFVPNSTVKEDGVDWTELISRSAGERFAFDLLTRGDGYNPSKPNIRQGFLDIFSGSGGATSRGLLLDISAREVTRGEKLFADTANGAGATKANSATMTFEGAISGSNVEAAWELP